MADLGSAISRLEQVTERLMRFEASLAAGGGSGVATAAAPAVSSSSVNSAAAATAAPSSQAAAAGAAAGLAEHDRLLAEQLEPFMAAAALLGGDALAASAHVDGAFREQRGVVAAAARSRQPDAAALTALLEPVAKHMMAAAALADNRRSPAFNQLKVVAEALQGLSWLAYTGPSCGMHPPAQHVGECWNAAEFYANKTLKEPPKGADEAAVKAWVRAAKALFVGLQGYVRAQQPSGLRWNPSGGSAADAKAAAAAAAAGGPGAGAAAAAAAPRPAAGRPPPPAPPPPPGLAQQLLKERPGAGGKAAAADNNGNAAGGGGGMQEVLKALNQGSGITAGLRKVTDAMKSKSRPDRGGAVPAGGAVPPSAAAPASPAAGAKARGTPRLELVADRKWVVEHHAGAAQELLVEVADPRHTVYVFGCSDCVVRVKGKCNALSIDACTKVGVVFDAAIATCELVNCARVQVQCTGRVPTLSVDKCDGVQAFLPAALAADPNFQVVTAKSSEVNLLVVAPEGDAKGEEEDEAVQEHAVPEQFISAFVNGRLVTTAASHGGG